MEALEWSIELAIFAAKPKPSAPVYAHKLVGVLALSSSKIKIGFRRRAGHIGIVADLNALQDAGQTRAQACAPPRGGAPRVHPHEGS
jgi:hypothetical protein